MILITMIWMKNIKIIMLINNKINTINKIKIFMNNRNNNHNNNNKEATLPFKINNNNNLTKTFFNSHHLKMAFSMSHFFFHQI